MEQAKVGDTVKVHYEGLLNDGSVFDSSIGGEPFEFVIGQDMVIPGFENAVVGMNVGESRSVEIPPEEGFGNYSEDLQITLERTQLPKNIDPKLGMRLEIHFEEGETRYFIITELTEDNVTLDGNHPLAGQEIVLKIELLEIV
jgi:FKBP-type peptidyl-prolyl cis-trans isomerase 2